jgi:hypothetical protein
MRPARPAVGRTGPRRPAAARPRSPWPPTPPGAARKVAAILGSHRGRTWSLRVRVGGLGLNHHGLAVTWARDPRAGPVAPMAGPRGEYGVDSDREWVRVRKPGSVSPDTLRPQGFWTGNSDSKAWDHERRERSTSIPGAPTRNARVLGGDRQGHRDRCRRRAPPSQGRDEECPRASGRHPEDHAARVGRARTW